MSFVTLTAPQFAAVLAAWILWLLWATLRIKRANQKLRKSQELLNASTRAAYEILDAMRPIENLTARLKEVWVDLPTKNEEEQLELAALVSLGVISPKDAEAEMTLAKQAKKASKQIDTLRAYLDSSRGEVTDTYEDVIRARDRLLNTVR